MPSPHDHDELREAERQARRARNQAESVVWKLILVPVVLLIVAGVVGGVIWYAMSQKAALEGGEPAATPAESAPPAPPATAEGGSTYECGGNMRAALAGQSLTSSGPGPAIRASGNCELTLTEVTVSGPVAIEASGNAKVTVVGGALTGTDRSIVASANARVSVSGATVTGDVDRRGRAEITGL